MIYIENYKKEDSEQLKDFLKTCFNALGWEYKPDSRHKDITDIEQVYMKNGCFWCLKNDESIIGTVAIKTLKDNIAELKRLYILPTFQGNGYGKLLMNTAVEFAKDRACKAIRLDCQRNKIAALNLYKVFGFVEIDRYNQNEFAEVFMELILI
jgi:putative acetyltransferase